MYYLIRVLLVLILKNLVASQSDEEIFADSRLSLQRTIQIIMLDGQVDNNCTLRNSNEKTEKRLTDVKWKWTRNGTVLVNKSDKFEIISNEFSSRLVKRAANFSDTGLYACIASFGQLEEKNIDFKLIVIGMFNKKNRKKMKFLIIIYGLYLIRQAICSMDIFRLSITLLSYLHMHFYL